MEYLKIIIRSDHKKNGMFQQIIEKNQNCWRKFNSSDDIFRWLSNFSNEREIYHALVLANGICYYTLDEIRYLWNLILTNRVKLSLLNEKFPNDPPPNIENWFQEYLAKKCVFVGYGKAGKSGQFMVYLFSHPQPVQGLVCMELSELLQYSEKAIDKEIVFLLDDFIGSGDQASREWRKEREGKSLARVSEKNPDLKFVYLALVGCKEGKEAIERNTPMKVILGEELDERFKCFSSVSEIYKDPTERAEAEKIMREKGRMLYEHPLGYDNMQLAVTFCHNTPNDSLPVIWKRMPDRSWWPLFERFE
jgi:hypothetical protein